MDSTKLHKKERSYLHSLRWGPVILVFLFVTSACSHLPFTGTPQPSKVSGTTDQPPANDTTLTNKYSVTGKATWYAKRFNGRRTASGEVYRMNKMTAAHKTLPFDSQVLVKSIDTGRTVVVRVNDRGPFPVSRVIDLSYAAAKQLGIIGRGNGQVQVTLINEDGVLMPKAARLPDDDEDIGPYSLQVGTFKTIEAAENLVAILEKDHDQVSMIEDKGLFKVRVGAFHDPYNAESLKKDLEKKGYRVYNVKQVPMIARNDAPKDSQVAHN